MPLAPLDFILSLNNFTSSTGSALDDAVGLALYEAPPLLLAFCEPDPDPVLDPQNWAANSL